MSAVLSQDESTISHEKDENFDGKDVENAQDSVVLQVYTDKEKNRVKWKVDLYLMPLMYVIYGLQQLDKTSISSQYLFGIAKATHMVGTQYNWLSTIFYLTYMFAEFPSNWIIQRYNIGKILTGYIFLWGSTVMLTAACKNWTQLMALKALQGIFECTIGPGFLLIISSWYTQQEHAARALIFMSANSGMGIISDIAIYFFGTAAQRNPDGLPAWKAIGIFIGGWTVLVAIISFFILGTPNEVWWLTKEEKAIAIARVDRNMAGTDQTGKRVLNWGQVREAFRDPNAWFITLNALLVSIPNGGVSAFGTIINKSFGFTQEQVIIYGIPRLCYNIVWFYFICFMTSKIKNIRMIFMLVSELPAFAGFLALSLVPADVSYKWTKWSLYLIATVFSTPLFLGWSMVSSNTAGKTKKSVVASMVFVAYCVGNMIGSQVFRTKDAPRYVKATIGISCCIGVEFFVLLFWRFYLVRENKRRDQALADSGMTPQAAELEGAEFGYQDMTDLENPHFRYAY
ncbi:major facilitator superfamily domain-containing protein [Naematelia encephala]|uniref:Major facilitator superfamily domain-containing protein n=1 Tax=Naematelia encephala TaxID=71784 RepID=A0A1Y2AR49_9TREE|nr:major facilitator superfamily domain-containing protein [Naematelia encephala]